MLGLSDFKMRGKFMKILFITNIPSPYRVEFFNELSKYCDLTVCFERNSSTERDLNWKSEEKYKFKSIFLRGIKIGTSSAFCPGITGHIKSNQYDFIIVCGVSTPTAILSILYMKAHKVPYYIECDGGIPSNSGGIKEKIKRKLVPGAKGYFSTGKLNDEYLFQYGITEDKIIRYPFTSYHHGEMPSQLPSCEDKAVIREKLGMTEKNIIISVGRFSYMGGYGKGYDVLLKASNALSADTGVYIIGDNPTAEFVEMKDRMGLSNVHFVGFKSKIELMEYYKAADIFVLMTVSDVWGLVINEAMSYGLPTITTELCGAGVELIENGENGYIIPVGDEEKLSEKINAILTDKDLYSRMRFNAFAAIKPYTLENMAKAHIDAMEKIQRDDA